MEALFTDSHIDPKRRMCVAIELAFVSRKGLDEKLFSALWCGVMSVCIGLVGWGWGGLRPSVLYVFLHTCWTTFPSRRGAVQ